MAPQQWRFLVISFVTVLLLLLALHSFTASTRGVSTIPFYNPDRSTTAAAPVWLIATISPAHGLQRRSIIRATWQSLYKNDSLYTPRFVISDPGKRWKTVIEHENSTYGDIIILRHLEETAKVANSIKTVEFFKYLSKQGQEGKRWDFVSKIDEDSFLDPNAYYREYLAPLLDRKTPASQMRTMIGREMHWPNAEWSWMGGQFYTLTWDLVELLARLHDKDPIDDNGEDELNGRLLFNAKEHWEWVNTPNRVAFDIYANEGSDINGEHTAWAPTGADLDAFSHGVGPGAINPHKMKEDQEYLDVAACYGKGGLLPPPY